MEGHGSAHIYIDQWRLVDMETIDKKLDKIVHEAKRQEFKEKAISTIKSIFQKSPKNDTIAPR